LPVNVVIDTTTLLYPFHLSNIIRTTNCPRLPCHEYDQFYMTSSSTVQCTVIKGTWPTPSRLPQSTQESISFSKSPIYNQDTTSPHFFPFASSTALILSLAARLPPNFGPEGTAPAAAEPALAFAAGWRRERFRASACARKSALKASAAAASGSRCLLLSDVMWEVFAAGV